MGFVEAIETGVVKFFEFEGRASRSEFWYWVLFYFIGSIVTGMIDPTINFIFAILVFIPSLTVTARRLHDTNHSGWWQLLPITIIGWIPLLYWLIIAGDRSDNVYGAVTVPNDNNPAGNYQGAIDELREAAVATPAAPKRTTPRVSVASDPVTFGKR